MDSVSDETIRQHFKNQDQTLKKDQWCIGEVNGEFLCRMEDVLSEYEKPYNPEEPMICFDEKPYQLLEHAKTPLSLTPGKNRRPDYHYIHKGTCQILCAVEPKEGRRLVEVTDQKSCIDYAEFIKWERR